MPVASELSVIGIMGIGTTELVIFGIIVLVVFGSSRLPTLMRSLGRSANEFKAGLKDPVSEFKDEVEETKKDSEIGKKE